MEQTINSVKNLLLDNIAHLYLAKESFSQKGYSSFAQAIDDELCREVIKYKEFPNYPSNN